MRGMLGLSMSPIASAIRLAGTSVVSGLIDSSRSILNFNGTQYIELDNKITITGECEIEWFGTWPGASGGWFFADTTNDDEDESRFLTTGTGISGWGFPSNTILADVPAPDLIHHFQFIRSGTGVSFVVNGDVLATESYSGPISLNSFFTKWGSNTSIPNFSGVFFEITIIQAGSRTNHWSFDDNAGTLDDSIGGNTGTVVNYVSGDWEVVTKKTGDNFWLGENVIRLTNASTVDAGWTVLTDYSASVLTSKGGTQSPLISIPSVLVVGAIYKCEFEAADLTGNMLVGFSSTSFSNDSEDRFISADGRLESNLNSTSTDFRFAGVSVTTGVIVSGDIKKLSVKRYIRYADGAL